MHLQALLTDLRAELPGARAAAEAAARTAEEAGKAWAAARFRAGQLAAEAGAAADGFRAAWGGLAGGVPPELALPLPAWLAAAAQAPLGGSLNIPGALLHGKRLDCSTPLETALRLLSGLVHIVPSD